MPEHAEHEGAGRVFDGLDRVVFGRPTGDREATPHVFYPLVVVRLDRRPPRAGGAGGERVAVEAHLVVGEGAWRVAVLLVAEHVREVLLDGAPVGDVEDLHPAADAEDGHLTLQGSAYQRELEGVALLLHGACLWVPFVPVEGGIQVPSPSRYDERVQKLQDTARVFRISPVGRQQDRTPAGALYGLDVTRRAD